MSEAQADRIGELTNDIKRLIQENDGKDDLIRELVAALDLARAFIDSNDTYGPRAVNLFSDVVGALANAKAAGFEP